VADIRHDCTPRDTTPPVADGVASVKRRVRIHVDAVHHLRGIRIGRLRVSGKARSSPMGGGERLIPR